MKKEIWPLRVKVVKGNPYGLPVGKEFIYAREKEGNGSPWPIEIFGDRRYQMARDEVSIWDREKGEWVDG